MICCKRILGLILILFCSAGKALEGCDGIGVENHHSLQTIRVSDQKESMTCWAHGARYALEFHLKNTNQISRDESISPYLLAFDIRPVSAWGYSGSLTRGYDPGLAIEHIMNFGICKAQVPSVLEDMRSLDKLIEFESYLTVGLENQSETLPNQQRDRFAKNLSDSFQQVIDWLGRFRDEPAVESSPLYTRLKRVCDEKRAKFSIPGFERTGLHVEQSEFELQISKALRAGAPAIAMVRAPTWDRISENHVVAIIHQKIRNGRCDYLIQDSYFENCKESGVECVGPGRYWIEKARIVEAGGWAGFLKQEL